MSDPLLQALAILGSVGRVAPFQVASSKIVVKGSEHGVRHGWFNHPLDFDPVWVLECSGFEQKEKLP